MKYVFIILSYIDLFFLYAVYKCMLWNWRDYDCMGICTECQIIVGKWKYSPGSQPNAEGEEGQENHGSNDKQGYE